ncbi:hypothetical protein CC99x_002985 [Candidatus Berkiella cookevillensis]|uniref:Uncharacterized protein n=1 Tax=Candidatus Berkiella cookevillensis TaxID=437022 RepID=A0A0Q9YDG0_9GAMM|nr:hypothetical protein [Candidatus Berkiella cookevillensis]MCS5707862.1 hypothetical protein [Candidatus Berkiella cookevillensis]
MLNQLFQAMIVYTRLCFFKDSPASLPYSHLQLMLVMGICLFMRVIAFGTTLKIDWTDKIITSMASLILLAVFIYALLAFNKKPDRFHKLLSAMLGVEIIVSLIIYPLGLILPNNQVPAPLVAIIMLWILSIKGNIFRKGLEFKFSSSVLIAFAMECFSYIPQSLIVFSLVAAQAPVK